jgi:hypothetical protein
MADLVVPAIRVGKPRCKFIAPSGAEKRVEALTLTCRLTTCISGTRPGMTRMALGQRLVSAYALSRG